MAAIKQKVKHLLPAVLILCCCLLAGGAMGYLIGRFSDDHGLVRHLQEGSAGTFLLNILLLFVLILLGLFLQLIVHEGGHLIFGLATGYRFLSFRIGSLTLVRSAEGRSEWKRLNIAGTAGQCLLSPPQMTDGRFPYVLYNLGGSLMNLLTGAVSFGLFAATREGRYLPVFLLGSAMFGLVFALTNGIPMKTALISNDGYNAVSLGKDPEALRAFWLQLKINEQLTLGVRLREMPEEWFTLPADADLQNPMISTIAVFRENRLMDALDFDGASAQIDLLKSGRCRIIGIYDALLTLDRVYLDLLRRGKDADLAPLSEKQTTVLLRQMRQFPSVLRTRYAASLARGDEKDARKALRQFEKVRHTYPSPAEIAAEADLIAAVRQKFQPPKER